MDALAGSGGQQVLSPHHAMGCNPAMMVDPLGLQSGKSDPTPGSLLISGNNPGTSGWGAITGYYRSMLGSQARPPELQMLSAMAMMRILSGDAAGSATRTSVGGGGMMTSNEQMAQQSNWKRRWRRYQRNRSENQKNVLDAFAQFVYTLNNGYEIDFNHAVLDEVVVQGRQETPAVWEEYQHKTIVPGLTYTDRRLTPYGESVMAKHNEEMMLLFRRFTPLGKAISITQSIYEMANKPHKYAGMTGNEIISKYRKASVREEFPGQYLNETWETIVSEANKGIKPAQTAKKLLTDGRFNK